MGQDATEDGLYRLTPRRAAEILGVHQTTIKRWADAGRIGHIRTPGGQRRFRRADLDAFLERSREGAA